MKSLHTVILIFVVISRIYSEDFISRSDAADFLSSLTREEHLIRSAIEEIAPAIGDNKFLWISRQALAKLTEKLESGAVLVSYPENDSKVVSRVWFTCADTEENQEKGQSFAAIAAKSGRSFMVWQTKGAKFILISIDAPMLSKLESVRVDLDKYYSVFKIKPNGISQVDVNPTLRTVRP